MDIDTLGKTLKADTVFGSVEAVKIVSDLFLPIDGIINEVNPMLANQPDLVNSDPYGKGWMIKMTVADELAVNKLLSADEYMQLVP